MNTEAIIATLLAAAAFLKRPIQDVASQSIKDAYGAVKDYLRRKLGEHSEAADALELATAKPESLLRKSVLVEESASADLANDAELARLVAVLAAALPPSTDLDRRTIHVVGHGNHVQVAGRDLIHTTRVVHRNVITPDERHLTTKQRERFRLVIGDVAASLAAGGQCTNFAEVPQLPPQPSLLVP